MSKEEKMLKIEQHYLSLARVESLGELMETSFWNEYLKEIDSLS